MLLRTLLLSIASSLILSGQPTPLAVPPSQIQNGSFAKGELGKVPEGWFIPKASKDAGFRAELVEDTSLPGRRAAVVGRESGSGLFGNLMQTLDAKPYRGKRIRLRSGLRVASTDGAKGHLWLRVDLPGNQMGFFDNMDARPVSATSWTAAEIVGDVDGEAVALALGAMLTGGNGRLAIAPVTLEILGDSPTVVKEGPRPLTARGLQNLTAFTKALNYLRFFHPSDAAAAADWNRLAIEGVRTFEGAVSAVDLAGRLRVFFTVWAPTAQVLAPGEQMKPWTSAIGATHAVRWRHVGFGPKEGQSPYRSSREYLSLKEGKTRGWPSPTATLLLDLGDGIRLALPTVCVAAPTKATLPPTTTPPQVITATLPEPTAGVAGSGDDRATRLADVALAWGVLQHFYPYFDVIRADWPAELPRALRSAAQDQDAAAFGATLRRMVAALQDGHGGVHGVRDPIMAVPAVGFRMVDGKAIVAFCGTSAKVIPLGSQLLSVNREPIERRIGQLRTEISTATQGWLEAQLEKRLLAVPSTGAVEIGYLAPDGSRGTVRLPQDANPWDLASQDPRKPGPVQELKAGIWYVDLDRVQEQAFSAALPKLAAARGVVFDLRGYPKISPSFLQHLSDRPLESAQWNIPVVTAPDRKGWEWNTSGRWNLKPLEPRIRGKVAFLTGGGAISYAESCLGIVEAYKLADIVGSPSAGTNGNVNPIILPGGYRISWTGMKVLKHDGSRHHGVGILPTIPVNPTLAGLAAGRDEILEKGIEVVSR